VQKKSFGREKYGFLTIEKWSKCGSISLALIVENKPEPTAAPRLVFHLTAFSPCFEKGMVAIFRYFFLFGRAIKKDFLVERRSCCLFFY
jgi:hypothetical protein